MKEIEPEIINEAPEPTGLAIQPQAQGFPGGLVPLGVDPKAALIMAQDRSRAIKGIRLASLNVLSPTDWVDMGGKPYLQATGANKLRSIWGIGFSNKQVDYTPREIRQALEEGKNITVSMTATVRCAATGEEDFFMGSRSTDDKFFGGQQEKGMTVDPGHVIRAAESNLMRRAITILTGLQNVTWEEVKTHTGMDASGASGAVEYKKGSKGGAQGHSQGQPNGGTRPATESQIKYLGNLLKKVKAAETFKVAYADLFDAVRSLDTGSMDGFTAATASQVIQDLQASPVILTLLEKAVMALKGAPDQGQEPAASTDAPGAQQPDLGLGSMA